MKNILITIAVVLLVGCGPNSNQDENLKNNTIAGDIESVKQDLANGANVNATFSDNNTSLHLAIIHGHKEIIKLLILNGADVNAIGDLGRTPLDWIGTTGEIADLLCEHGAKSGDWLDAGKSIYIAASAGHVEAIKKHMANGIDLNTKDEYGRTPLDHAIDQPETAEFLRAKGAKSGGEDSIYIAASVGHVEAIKKHIANGVDVNAKDEAGWTHGWTPLYNAAAYGHKEIAELLIAEGADVNAKDEYGETPLHSAAYDGSKEIIELLIAKGAGVNAKGENGCTPLYKAAAYGHKEIAELLIAKGAIVNAMDDGAETPLDCAIEEGHTEIADLLRKHGGKTGEELKAAGN